MDRARELVKSRKKAYPSEIQVASAWERRLFREGPLHTVDGRSLQVVFPGRRSGLRGPDFSGSLLVIGGALHKGNVEIHVRSSDFARHGHGSDRHYDDLVLHVVLLHDADGLALNGNVPILELGSLLEALPDPEDAAGAESGLPCAGAANEIGAGRLAYHLEQAGVARFRSKAGRFLGDITYFGEEEALYQGVMEALGYSQNKAQFLTLARIVPSAFLRTIAGSSQADAQNRIHHVLMWASGLDNGMEMPREAEAFGVRQLPGDEWEFSRLRPDNHPVNRISGASLLMARAYKQASGLKEYLLQAPGSYEEYSALNKRLAVRSDSGALIGPQRASEIAINVILPFAYALAELKGDAGTAGSVLDIYKSVSKGSENHITGEMYRQFGLSRASVKTACRQQGLLHIYKERCQDLRCADCSIASEIVR